MKNTKILILQHALFEAKNGKRFVNTNISARVMAIRMPVGGKYILMVLLCTWKLKVLHNKFERRSKLNNRFRIAEKKTRYYSEQTPEREAVKERKRS
jgi:hypothetical protein